VSNAANVVAAAPQARQARAQRRILLPQHSAGVAFELVRQAMRSLVGWRADEQMHMLGHDFQGLDSHIQLRGLLVKQDAQIVHNRPQDEGTTKLGKKNNMILGGKDAPRMAKKKSHVKREPLYSIFKNYQTIKKG